MQILIMRIKKQNQLNCPQLLQIKSIITPPPFGIILVILVLNRKYNPKILNSVALYIKIISIRKTKFTRLFPHKIVWGK